MIQNNKLISLLQTFSTSDLAKFRKYVVSPFFNENQELVLLFDALRPIFAPSTKTATPADKLGVWSGVFPGRAYDDIRFRRICSDLLRLALDFISYQEFEKSPGDAHAHLLEALTGSTLQKHFDGAVRQAEKTLEETNLRDAHYHYFSYCLHRKQQEQLEHNPDKEALFGHLTLAAHHLDCYYLSKKLELYTDSLGYQDILSDALEIPLFPGLLEHLKSSPYLAAPSVKAWYLVVLMRLHPDQEDYFLHLKNLVAAEGGHFGAKELHTFFIHLMNYCIYTKINKDRPDYYAELFSLYEIALDKQIIFRNGQLSPHHFKNIITISLRLGKFDWVENFIETFTHLLPESDKENAYNYNLANVYFSKKEYGKVIEQLREVEYQNITYTLGSKLLLLRTYYELGETSALDSLIDSFRVYLHRNQEITSAVKQQYMNTLRFTKKLVGLAPFDDKAKAKITDQIEHCKTLVLKGWLLEKVREIGR